MKSQRWWTARRHGLGAELVKERDREVSAIEFGNHRKTGRLQRAAVPRRVRHEARFSRCRPRHGIGQLAVSRFHDIVYPEKRAWPQHAMDLRTELGFVLDIHADVQHVGAVESAIGEGHRKRTALMQ